MQYTIHNDMNSREMKHTSRIVLASSSSFTSTAAFYSYDQCASEKKKLKWILFIFVYFNVSGNKILSYKNNTKYDRIFLFLKYLIIIILFICCSCYCSCCDSLVEVVEYHVFFIYIISCFIFFFPQQRMSITK